MAPCTSGDMSEPGDLLQKDCFTPRIGKLVEGRVVAVSEQGLQLQLAGQPLPALLPSSALPEAWPQIGDDLEGLLVACVSNGAASVVVPMSAGTDEQQAAQRAQQVAGRGRGRGRGQHGRAAGTSGRVAATEPTPISLACAGEYDSSCNSNGKSPSILSGACVRPHVEFVATPVHAETCTASDVPDSHVHPTYTLQKLLQCRPRPSQDTSQLTSLPATSPCPEEELEPHLLQAVVRGELPPSWWRRCSVRLKRQALLVALRAGQMHAVFAMQPESDQFRQELVCFEPDVAFLEDAMHVLCTDAKLAASTVGSSAGSTAGSGSGKAHPRVPASASEGFSEALFAAALEAWSRRSAGVPRGYEAVAWLLERGAPCNALLPEEPGPEALASRIRGLSLLAELGRSTAAASQKAVAAVAGCLRDPEVKGRRAAAETLAKMGPAAATGAPRAIPRLIRLMQQEKEPLCREAAARALGCFGTEGIEAVAGPEGLGHTDPEVRGLAALALGHAGADAASHAGTLMTWLRPRKTSGANPEVFELGPDAEPRECGQSVEVAGHLRARAAQVLGMMGSALKPDAFAVLAESATTDTDPTVREAAVTALGLLISSSTSSSWEREAAQTALVVALDDPTSSIREAAARAMDHMQYDRLTAHA